MNTHDRIIINGISYTGGVSGKDLTIVCKIYQQEQVSDILGQDVPYFFKGVQGTILIMEIKSVTVNGDDITINLKLR